MKIKDERVSQLTNKIQSEAYYVALFLLTTSVFIKSYVMDMSFSQYAVELGIILLSSVYIAIRGMFLGYEFVNNSKNGKILVVAGIVTSSLVLSIVSGIKNYSLYGDKYTGIFDGHFIAALVVTFFSTMIFISVVVVLLYWMNKIGQQRIEKKLNEEDELD
ncbi:DUF6773 family protein [Rubeoparvulum massiliense]|uniref:DUF6773 family protein n=1 Tax=Rubeoparvulum massiliense TaxID=1631346 RepID=UPI00065E5F91|nr:DUF6773 family protein [Rubeoparvulum massiliense]